MTQGDLSEWPEFLDTLQDTRAKLRSEPLPGLLDFVLHRRSRLGSEWIPYLDTAIWGELSQRRGVSLWITPE